MNFLNATNASLKNRINCTSTTLIYSNYIFKSSARLACFIFNTHVVFLPLIFFKNLCSRSQLVVEIQPQRQRREGLVSRKERVHRHGCPGAPIKDNRVVTRPHHHRAVTRRLHSGRARLVYGVHLQNKECDY